MITTPLGPEFVKNDDQSGAKSGDHTHSSIPKPSSRWSSTAGAKGVFDLERADVISPSMGVSLQ
jgi:hypothetical protein